jgi:Short C-terminal domain
VNKGTVHLPTPVPAAAGAAGAPANRPDELEQMKKLAEMRGLGLITAQEFESKKAELLKRM